MSALLAWFRSLFAERPCDCDGCTGRVHQRSNSMNVSHGLHMEVGRDGKLHWRSKSRHVGGL